MDVLADLDSPAADDVAGKPSDAAEPAPPGTSAGPARSDGSMPSEAATAMEGAISRTTSTCAFGDTFSGLEVFGSGAEGLASEIAEAVTHARHVDYAASAGLVCHVQRGERLTSDQLYGVVYSQASRTWWELVSAQVSEQGIPVVHALRRVRAWARHYLTGEPAAARPGTLFDHALAHASRAAARQFLAASGELLAGQTTQQEESNPEQPVQAETSHPEQVQEEFP
ncbi:hypothetical protein ACFY05_39820 [Microtetraspora fusca]|uniref:Uncharacterized protein n=1 Tax=Microtetraspora fusca TaxID=1997 RepID=A0ABW6VIE8_MICFU